MNKCPFFYAVIALGLMLSLIRFSGAAWAASEEEIAQSRADIRKMAEETLARLYKLQPAAEKAIGNSAGYAVFSNFGTKIFLIGGGAGKGIVFDKKSKKEIFMKMIEGQAGLGLGVKKFRLVWVFENHQDVNDFINSGWEFSGQTSVAAKLGEQGGAFAGAMSISPGIWLYQLTDDGLALELTGKGTRYYKNDELN